MEGCALESQEMHATLAQGFEEGRTDQEQGMRPLKAEKCKKTAPLSQAAREMSSVPGWWPSETSRSQNHKNKTKPQTNQPTNELGQSLSL